LRKKKTSLKKRISLFLSIIMLITMIPSAAFADGAVVTDATDLDVFMNLDPSLGIDTTDFKGLVEDKLDDLISMYEVGADTTSYRFKTSSATIDPTDITKWEVYSHYDTRWYGDSASWYANYNGGVIPSNWYYYPVTDQYMPTANTKTTIETMLSDKAGTTTTGSIWGQTAGLDSHIYAYKENSKPAMQFYGYGTSNWSDFLYYPASATSTKTVDFDVDASNVLPHSLKYAGFLINAGTTGTGSAKTMDGYMILFQYGPANSTSAATTLIGVYLYKLTGANVDTLHANGLKGLASSTTSGYTLVGTSSFNTLYTKSHISLDITSTGLKATIQQINTTTGELTGSSSYLFGSADTYQTLETTGFGGFGPYVDYGVTGHSCSNTSSFRYSNLEMSFAETMSGDSALEAYKYADYLNDSDKRFFVNLTSDSMTPDYSIYSVANDTDKAYLSLIAEDETVLITDEKDGTYLENTLGNNAKNVYDVDDSVIADLVEPGASSEEILAAKVAWLIYSTVYDSGSTTVTPPSTVAIASLLLMDGPGTSASAWTGASQVNQVKKELMQSGGLDIYLNSDSSQNADGLTATYSLTYPNGSTSTITPTTDTDNNNKLYFNLPNTAAAGEYKVTLHYAAGGSVSSTIDGTAYFDVLTDSVSPTIAVSVSGSTASLTFTNREGTGSSAYTSALDSYAVYIDTSSTQPTVSESSYTNVSGTTASVNLSTVASEQGLTLATGTTYYLHVLLRDAAGNIGHSAESFTFNGPVVAFTNPADNTYTAESPYEGSSVTFSLTAGTHAVASYKIGTGASVPTYDADVSATGLSSVDYELPTGEYRLWVAATDTEGGESVPISIYVDNRKSQSLNGTDSYVLEAGVDEGATLNYTSSSSPDLESGESLGEITYTKATDPNNVISLTDGAITIGNYLGTATINVTAAETTSHRQATDLITVRVVKPFTVSLTASGYDAGTGITIVPTYTDQGSFGVGSTRELKYRKIGTADWTTVPTADWSWGTGYTIAFSGLETGTDYEILLSGQNARTTATTDTAVLLFKTPAASAEETGTGTGTVTIKDTENGDEYNISIQDGDTVLDSDVITGDGGDITYTFDDLPDGFYNIVVTHEDETVTDLIEIKDGVQVSGTSMIEFVGTSSTRLTVGTNSPAIAVGNLNALLGDGTTTNTDDSAGITVTDSAILASGGAILIELVSTGLEESDVPDDITKINEIKGGQTLAMLVDLSLYKTVWELNAAAGTTSQMKSASDKLEVAIPLTNVNGSNVKVYRVHEGVAQLIPEATLASDNTTYVWADNYVLDGSTTLTKGATVGTEEFVVLYEGYAVLHVDKFSTYAFAYTPSSSSGSSRSATTKTVTISDTNHGTVSVDSTAQRVGNTVTVTITPDDGYVLSKLSILDGDGKAITYTEKTDGKYQFTMPSSAVTIKAEFSKKQNELADPADTGVAKWLVTDDHIRYMVGDNNGYFNPDKNMTRAEAAQMFYNLLINKDVDSTESFADVSEGAWYKKAVETLATLGIVTGYDGDYNANKYITRAEFTAMAMRFATIAGGNASFSDVSDTDWAYQYIMSAAGYGWIGGYSDGTYKPQALITRAEVVTIVNNMLGRSADEEYINNNLSQLKIFPDVTKSSYWAYYGIVEATNAHDFDASTGEEVWTEIK